MNLLTSIAAAAAAVFIAPSVSASPFYFNSEINSGFSGWELNGHTIDNHIGVEGGYAAYSYYLQGGPAILIDDVGSTEVEASAKAGGNITVTSDLDLYGEVSVLTTDDDPNYGLKAGFKYHF